LAVFGVANSSSLAADAGPIVLVYTARGAAAETASRPNPAVSQRRPTIASTVGDGVAIPGEANSFPYSASSRLTDLIRLEISRSQHRVALYHGTRLVKRYPVAVGRAGWETPLGEFHIFQMVQDPDWKHPLTGKVFRAGERGNELGHYWIGFWTNGKICAGFHGTPHPETVGKSASHGCIRMHEKDIEDLFAQIDLGTPVTVKP